MKERGMIFKGDLVLSILEGRKTQTRRPITPQPELTARSVFSWKGRLYGAGSYDGETNRNFAHVKCPHGKPGDRIWVRETFQGPLFDFDQMDSYCKDSTPFEKPKFCVYKADGKPAPEFFDADDNLHCCWRPSIHMPRWASRLLLEITDVRVERLNDISEGDAQAEGTAPATHTITPPDAVFRVGYGDLWRSIYGENSWQDNPWVWVIEFKQITEDE